MAIFNKLFSNIIKEQDEPELEAPAVEPSEDRTSMEAELDKGTVPQEFDVKAVTREQMASRQTNSAQAIELQTWVRNIDKFLQYLNSPDINSVQTQLHMAPCDTLFEKLPRAKPKRLLVFAWN